MHHCQQGPAPMSARRLVRLAALALFVPLVTPAGPGSAAELTLDPIIVSDQDLLRVVPRDDGMIGVLQAGSIELIGADGAVARRVDAAIGERLYLADDGSHTASLRFRPGAADYAPTESFELRGPSGARIWAVGPSDDVTYAVSARGAVVGLSLNVNVPERNRLHFYGSDGSLTAEFPIPHLLGGRFDSAGDAFLARSSSAGLVALDTDGRELWRLPAAGLFDSSPGGIAVAAVGDGRLQLVRAGKVVASAELHGLLVRRVAIAPDGSRVAIAGRSELRVYGGAGLDPLWQLHLDAGLVFTSVDLAADDGWLLAGVARDLGPDVPIRDRHPSGEVRAYDSGGRLRHIAHLDFPTWNIWTPTAMLDRSGRTATITTRRAVFRTALP